MNAKTISIFSNKGGVGKTFVAVNLGTALALAGYKVLLIDLDFQAGQDMARMLNLSPRKSIADSFAQVDETTEPEVIQSYVVSHSSGFHFIPAVKNTKEIGHISPDNLKPFLKNAAKCYEYIVIDTGKSFSETLITIFDYSNLIMLIATPDILAVYQIKWCMEVLQSLQFPNKMVKLVLNRSESRGSVAWQEVRSALTCEIISHIPSDGKAVGMALNQGVPCVIDSPKSKVSDAFFRLVNLFKTKDVFVQTTDIERQRTTDGITSQQSQFWEKFGISRQMETPGSGEAAFSSAEDEIIAIKQKVHERLVERLNMEGIRLDALTDEQTVKEVKKLSEKVVSNLLMEEAGGRIVAHDERRRLVRDIINEALGLGPLEDFLADGDVTDIMVNNRNQIYVEKNGKIFLTNKRFISDQKLRAIIDRIIAPLGRRIDESTPMVDARLPDGSRVNAIIPPLSLNGPMITIRKFGVERLELRQLLERYSSLSKVMGDFLQACVLARKNMIVSGGTGSGKTTLLNIISEFIPDDERIITIEDAAELRLKKIHWARLESRPKNVEGKGEITIRDLFTNSLRMRPDRIVIGECRGGEVLDMLQAMNTGHDGSLTTLHANSTSDVMTRMHAMILLSGIELPVRAINEMIASAIDVIVHVNRFSDGTRKITGISETLHLDEEFHLKLADIFLFNQTGISDDGKVVGEFVSVGNLPTFYDEFAKKGIVLDKEMFSSGYKH
ncbi:MAG: Flp pilus assembly complex ATPase component TadA [Candidatus Omnitrophica bacterium]|nr:Flp pilus assembly complex ATPase component TadA [Candidatus Omnitrophota bacterium]